MKTYTFSEWRYFMDVNGIKGVSSVDSYTSTAKAVDTAKTSSYGKEAAAIYEKSSEAKSASSNKALVAKLQADAENRVSQMRSLVADMLSKQGIAIKTNDDMWKALANGNFSVDEAAAKEAQEAISEDGYWGVKQTSQRIFDFAVALSGGDSAQMDKMLDAFKKGFNEATKSWGKSLPDISSKTYDAVLEKFEAYKNGEITEEI